MGKNNWYGIMKVLDIQHVDADGKTIWEAKNIRNILHWEGEEFLLRAAFTGGQESTIIPEYYYLGLDNRQVISIEDTMDDLIGEPGSGGYERQEIASTGDFSINFESNHYVATSPIVAFRGTTGSWGPVSNIFLTAEVEDSDILISTITLPSAITVESGQTVTMRIGMQIRECVDEDE